MATSVDAKLLKATKFPVEFNQKVDMQKVNLEVMKKWIAGKIAEILGTDDDVVIELCFGLIEAARFPDIKKMQIQLTGFLDKDTPRFCKELWNLCLSAQSSDQGVPKELLEAKKLELIQERIDQEKAAELNRKRREDDDRRESNTNNIRQRERGGDRGRGGGGDRGRGGGPGRSDNWRGGQGRGDDRNRDFDRGGGGRGYDRRAPPRSSRSPPRRRDSRERDSFRGGPRAYESYVPQGRGGRRQNDRDRGRLSVSRSPLKARSESSSPPPRRRRRSTTRSRTPPRRRDPSPERRADTYHGSGRGRARSPDRRPRRRSPSRSDSSVSRSPRPCKRRGSSGSASPSPLLRSRRSRRDSGSRSLSSSRSPPPGRKSRATPSPDDDLAESGARRSRERDDRRLTRSRSRSRSRSATPPRRRRRSPSRSKSREPRDYKRRRRFMGNEKAEAPKRRNTSSISSADDTRERKADLRTASNRGSPERNVETKETNEEPNPQQQASILRERLLNKIKKMSTTNTESMKTLANA